MTTSWFVKLGPVGTVKRRLRWLFSKWSIAEALNRLRRICWADMVDWALYKKTGDPDEDESYMFRYRISGGEHCRLESADPETRTCYCGKFVDGGIRPKNWTPDGDAS